MIELVLHDVHYTNAVQTVCPHLLRYLTAAVVMCKRRRAVLGDLARIIQQEAYAFRDPITDLIDCLYVNFDFEGAQAKLGECEAVRLVVHRCAM